jgi:hypothetical protein
VYLLTECPLLSQLPAPCRLPPDQVQKGYLYLQPIFSAPDIQQQLALEVRARQPPAASCAAR